MTGKRSHKQGFTLIELLVAIFLTSIVFSMALGIYLSVSAVNSDLGADADVRDQLTDAQMAVTDFVRRYDAAGRTYTADRDSIPGGGITYTLTVTETTEGGTTAQVAKLSFSDGTLTWTENGTETVRTLTLENLEGISFEVLYTEEGSGGGLLRCTMTYGVESQYSADFALRVAELATAPETP